MAAPYGTRILRIGYSRSDRHTCSYTRSGGEVAEDENQDMVYEDGHFIPLVWGLLLHLDEDQVE